MTLPFSCPSSIHENHSPALITIQPSFSTIPCKTLNIFIKVCYPHLCLSNPIPADLRIPSLPQPLFPIPNAPFFSPLTTVH